jgi:hypothetical protein
MTIKFINSNLSQTLSMLMSSQPKYISSLNLSFRINILTKVRPFNFFSYQATGLNEMNRIIDRVTEAEVKIIRNEMKI